jgi:hypothetical protein
MSYEDVICFNCGEPGHAINACLLPKACHICKKLNHDVSDSPVRRQPHHFARYVGSAATGLGFYHIEMPPKPPVLKGNIGLVTLYDGKISAEELAKEFSGIYRTNWPWQIRILDSWSFLVKFPPHMDVEEVAGYPCFGLTKEGVTVKVEVWKGIIDYFGKMQEV